jgi:hypothetical protein
MNEESYIRYVAVTRIGGRGIPPMECRLLVRGGVDPNESTYTYETFCYHCNSRIDHGEQYIMKSYSEVYCSGCVEWEERGRTADGRKMSARRKKDILLRMAMAGEPRPKDGDRDTKADVFTHHQLRNAFRNYTDPKSPTYDKDFDETMRILQPKWYKRYDRHS